MFKLNSDCCLCTIIFLIKPYKLSLTVIVQEPVSVPLDIFPFESTNAISLLELRKVTFEDFTLSI